MTEPKTADPVEAVGQWLGVVLAGLVGALSFIGVKQDEVGVILRNESAAPSLVALLIALALAVSIVSVFLVGQKIRAPYGVAIVLAAVSVFPFTIRLTRTPSSTPRSGWAAVIVGLALIVAAVAFFGYGRRTRHAAPPEEEVRARFRTNLLPAQAIALLVAVFLASSAVYAAMRVETTSQINATGALVDGTITSTGDGAKINLHVRAAKLARLDEVRLSVYALPRDAAVSADDQMPCRTEANEASPCEFVGGSFIRPDAFGNADDTIEAPVDAEKYQHLAIIVVVCRGQACKQSKTTSLDFRVPEPPAAS